MKPLNDEQFNQDYQLLLNHLTLKGLQPKTIDAYSRAVRRLGNYFNHQIRDLTEDQLIEYFVNLRSIRSWSTVDLDLNGLKFFYRYVLQTPWPHVDLIKPPSAKRLPDIVTIEEAGHLFSATNKISYRTFYFTLYSLGLRIGEGLNLQIGDIDSVRMRIHVRGAKGNKDRFVPLPETTLDLLRRFWALHRNPVWLFPSRQGGLKASGKATKPMDRGGVQTTIRKVVEQCGIKKRLPLIA